MDPEGVGEHRLFANAMYFTPSVFQKPCGMSETKFGARMHGYSSYAAISPYRSVVCELAR